MQSSLDYIILSSLDYIYIIYAITPIFTKQKRGGTKLITPIDQVFKAVISFG